MQGAKDEPCTTTILAQVRPRVMPQRAARSVAKMAIDGRNRRENKSGLDQTGVDVTAKGDQTRVSYQGGGGEANIIEGSKTMYFANYNCFLNTQFNNSKFGRAAGRILDLEFC